MKLNMTMRQVVLEMDDLDFQDATEHSILNHDDEVSQFTLMHVGPNAIAEQLATPLFYSCAPTGTPYKIQALDWTDSQGGTWHLWGTWLDYGENLIYMHSVEISFEAEAPGLQRCWEQVTRKWSAACQS